MKLKKIHFLFALIILVAGCAKAPTRGSLQFNVIDDFGDPAHDARIDLFANSSDYANNTNIISSIFTDGNGVAFFSDLSPGTYFYYIKGGTDCSNNDFSFHSTAHSVSAGTTINEDVTINSTGTLNFKNFSNDPYDIYINHNYWATVNGQSTITTDELTGKCSIHVKQASGYVSTPKEEDFIANVTTCGTGDVPFP